VSKHDDLCVFVPIRFYDALELDDVTLRQFQLAVYVARRCYEAKNMSDGWAVVATKPLAERFEVSEDTITRDLHALELDWIQCDVKPGRRAWRIRLTGLASPAQPPRDLRTSSAPEGSPVRSLTSAERQSRDGASALPEPGCEPSEPPQSDSEPQDTRPDPTRANARGEEGIDTNVEGETTASRAREVDDEKLRDLREQLSRPCDDEKFLAALDEARGAQLPEDRGARELEIGRLGFDVATALLAPVEGERS
jgi:hypothetical protein